MTEMRRDYCYYKKESYSNTNRKGEVLLFHLEGGPTEASHTYYHSHQVILNQFQDLIPNGNNYVITKKARLNKDFLLSDFYDRIGLVTTS
ncbi:MULTISPECIES: hypothetical protein [unclassified Olleya]|jgi:hypothetical protein|uniref:hypothetical protein n=1 Tax=unclassified Olleya TaxID=2615019 RepID=UPI0011A18A1D|nr:hypothetical protein [Olleya sp. Hel_I_94]TVZ47719.1 hypothetical protein JM82_2341 [Olleya sp. Hel_I_94]